MSTTSAQDKNSRRARSVQERLAEKKKSGEIAHEPHLTILQKGRGYVDALVFAFLLAMFIRSFVFELFQIPTGSMTPTLIGDREADAAFFDYDSDGVDDVVYTTSFGSSRRSREYGTELQIFLMNRDRSIKDLIFLEDVDKEICRQIGATSPRRQDMIIVNKFAYWLSVPKRGDVAVFKVPDRPSRDRPFDPQTPVFIKRVTGLPGETLTFLPPNIRALGSGDPARYSDRWGGREVHLEPQPIYVNGRPLTDKPYDMIAHFAAHRGSGGRRLPSPLDRENIEQVHDDAVLMIGDNAASSSDGRYWGDVPLALLRGRAVLRYYPFKAFSKLR